MPATSVEELRSATRIGVRTPVVVYSIDGDGQLTRIRAWTDNLSCSGAKITSEQPLLGDQFYLRIMLPELKHQLIFSEVVREIQSSRDVMGNMFDIRRTFYGVRFVGLASEEIARKVEILDNSVLGR